MVVVYIFLSHIWAIDGTDCSFFIFMTKMKEKFGFICFFIQNSTHSINCLKFCLLLFFGAARIYELWIQMKDLILSRDCCSKFVTDKWPFSDLFSTSKWSSEFQFCGKYLCSLQKKLVEMVVKWTFRPVANFAQQSLI